MKKHKVKMRKKVTVIREDIINQVTRVDPFLFYTCLLPRNVDLSTWFSLTAFDTYALLTCTVQPGMKRGAIAMVSLKSSV